MNLFATLEGDSNNRVDRRAKEYPIIARVYANEHSNPGTTMGGPETCPSVVLIVEPDGSWRVEERIPGAANVVAAVGAIGPKPEPEDVIPDGEGPESWDLGRLLEWLETAPGSAIVKLDTGRGVHGICSWRGIYAYPTLDHGDPTTVDALTAEIRDALDGKTYPGYKGGSYTFIAAAPVYADPFGADDGVVVVGARLEVGTVIIGTKPTRTVL